MKGLKAVILAGGSGERFWPLSTPDRPKQFLSVFGSESLLRQTVSRLGGLVAADDVFVVTSSRLAPATRRELPEVPRNNIAGEPARRDTAAAVALGVGLAARDGGDPVIAFFPSDHLVAKPAKFRATLRRAAAAARKTRKIAVVGIVPSCNSSAFGYVDPATARFVEKPDSATAAKYVKAGFLWNAGMFIGRASVFREAFEAHAPELSPLAAPAKAPSARKLARIYAALPRISFDYAVMEKISRRPARNGNGITVLPGDFGWDDVGSFLSFDKYFPHDKDGNVREGPCALVESRNNICVSRSARIALVGVSNLVVVSTPGAVLIADKSSISGLKKAVSMLG